MWLSIHGGKLDCVFLLKILLESVVVVNSYIVNLQFWRDELLRHCKAYYDRADVVEDTVPRRVHHHLGKDNQDDHVAPHWHFKAAADDALPVISSYFEKLSENY